MLLRDYDTRIPELNALHASKQTYYLTGARVFGASDLYPDWDFFTDPDATSELIQMGYVQMPRDNAFDHKTICVMRKIITSQQFIHVAIVQDAQLRSYLQIIMEQGAALTRVNKLERRQYWDIALAGLYERILL